MNPSGSENNGIKSTAVVKYSASQSPAIFAQLQCNTDLNLPPANWLSNSTSVYGLQHVLFQSTGFSRYLICPILDICITSFKSAYCANANVYHRKSLVFFFYI